MEACLVYWPRDPKTDWARGETNNTQDLLIESKLPGIVSQTSYSFNQFDGQPWPVGEGWPSELEPTFQAILGQKGMFYFLNGKCVSQCGTTTTTTARLHPLAGVTSLGPSSNGGDPPNPPAPSRRQGGSRPSNGGNTPLPPTPHERRFSLPQSPRFAQGLIKENQN